MITKRILGIAASFLTATLPRAQEFRVDCDLVLVPVTVTDGRGASISGLSKESFTVLDDRRPQPIAAFYTEDAPCTVGLVMDASGSVRHRLDWEKDAVHTFLELSNPEDDYFVTTVSSSPVILAPAGTDLRAIEDQVRTVTAGGWTALFDGIRLAADQTKRSRRTCRAVFVISDGIDNHSRCTRHDLIRFLVEADVQVYTIAIGDTPSGRKGIQLSEDQRGAAFMNDLAAKTGGLSVRARESDNPSEAAGRISVAMRNHYVIGFRASDGDVSGKWHSIQVKIDRSKVNVYARSGYRLLPGLQ